MAPSDVPSYKGDITDLTESADITVSWQCLDNRQRARNSEFVAFF